MDSTKLENFQRDKPGRVFPHWESLTVAEGSLLRKRLIERLGIDSGTDPLGLVQQVQKLARNVAHSEPDEGIPDLAGLFDTLQIRPSELIYINWYRFDDIDRMTLSDFKSYFDYIWYPGADDIEVFDDSLNWILSISHNGAIGIAKLTDGRKKDSARQP